MQTFSISRVISVLSTKIDVSRTVSSKALLSSNLFLTKRRLRTHKLTMDQVESPSVLAPLFLPPSMNSKSLSPSDRITTKNVQTPNTQQSSPALSIATSLTLDVSTSERSEESPSGHSNRLIRVPLPSPSRARLDRQYAKRLPLPHPISTLPPTPRELPASSFASSSSHLFTPPGITRDSDATIFRPVPIVSPTINTEFPTTISPSYISPRNFQFMRDDNHHSSFGSASSTPTRLRTASDFGISDRFIPSRATSNYNINLWDSLNERVTPRSNATLSDDSASDLPGNQGHEDSADSNNHVNNARSSDVTASSQQNLHTVLLRSELLGENIGPYSTSNHSLSNSQMRSSATGGPLRDGVNHLRFHSPRQAYQENVFHEAAGATSVVNSFSLTPVGSAASQRLMAAPQKRKRRIAKVPFKVLDAPALQYDFYLDLIVSHSCTSPRWVPTAKCVPRCAHETDVT